LFNLNIFKDKNKQKKKKTWKNKIERDTELLQGAYFGGKPEHILKKKQEKKTGGKKSCIPE
jgi:hypothetical protein